VGDTSSVWQPQVEGYNQNCTQLEPASVITDTLVLILRRVPQNKYGVPSIRTLLAALLPLWFYIRTAKRSAESYFRLINNPFEIVKNFYSKSDSTESR